MFTSIDKAWVALLSPILLSVAEAIQMEGADPVAVFVDPNTWVVAVATSALVWAIPNKEKI